MAAPETGWGGGTDGAKRKGVGRELPSFLAERGTLSYVLCQLLQDPEQRETMAQPSAPLAHPSSAPQVSATLYGGRDGPCIPLQGP